MTYNINQEYLFILGNQDGWAGRVPAHPENEIYMLGWESGADDYAAEHC
jgi:hypothetical protein